MVGGRHRYRQQTVVVAERGIGTVTKEGLDRVGGVEASRHKECRHARVGLSSKRAETVDQRGCRTNVQLPAKPPPTAPIFNSPSSIGPKRAFFPFSIHSWQTESCYLGVNVAPMLGQETDHVLVAVERCVVNRRRTQQVLKVDVDVPATVFGLP